VRRLGGKTPLYCALAAAGKDKYANSHARGLRTMTLRSILGIAQSVVAIIACGALGAGAGYGLVALLGWSGVGGALLAVFVGMVVATAAWTGGSVLLRAVGLIR
jgi:hypothetical protein